MVLIDVPFFFLQIAYKILIYDNFIFLSRCKPKNNIAFIKTHKTGSTTITNILNRYGDLRDLNVVIPASGHMRFSWPRLFHWSSVDLLRMEGRPGNILCNHARYGLRFELTTAWFVLGIRYVEVLLFSIESLLYWDFATIIDMN